MFEYVWYPEGAVSGSLSGVNLDRMIFCTCERWLFLSTPAWFSWILFWYGGVLVIGMT